MMHTAFPYFNVTVQEKIGKEDRLIQRELTATLTKPIVSVSHRQGTRWDLAL